MAMRGGWSRLTSKSGILALALAAAACSGASSATIESGDPSPPELPWANAACASDRDCPEGMACEIVTTGEISSGTCVPRIREAGADVPSPAPPFDGGADAVDARVLPPVLPCGASLASPVAASPRMWLRADCLTLADGAPVASWDDARNNGLSASQAPGGAAPTFAATSIGGRPAVHFIEAAQDYLAIAPAFSESTYSVFVVAAPTSSDRLLALGSSQTNLFGFGLDYVVDSTGHHDDGLYIYACGPSYGDPMVGPHVLTGIVYPGTALENRWGFVSYSGAVAPIDGGWTGDCNFQPASTPFEFVGRASWAGQGWHYSDGDIAEILLFETALSDVDRHTVEGYLRSKYGL
jgi:hypothetical protein